MPAGSGRKSAPEWLEVRKLDSDKNKVKCNHCDSEISAKIERIKAHLGRCQKKITSSSIIATGMELNIIADTSLTLTQTAAEGANQAERADDTQGKGNKRQKLMVDFGVVQTTESQKCNLDLKLAKFFYANNIAFNAASSKEYMDMVKSLRPGYSGPSSFDLGGKLLDAANLEVDDAIQKQLQEKNSSITLLLDGWTNIKNDAIIATCIHTGKRSFFLNATSCEANKKTSDYCGGIAQEAIKHCKEKLGVEVFAICTDNENKMVKMREELEKDNENVVAYGCSAHYVNLLASEISNKDIMKHIVEVHKFFRNHHLPHAWLKEKSGLMPQLPNVTRWNSQLECLDTFVKNYQKYVEIQVEHPDTFPTNVCRILENLMIYRESLHMHKQMNEVGKILDCMQAETTNISHSVELWLDLVNNEHTAPYRKEISNRMNQALRPIHYVANMMDPKYAGRRLSPEQVQMAEDWLMEKHPEWLVPVMAFKIQDSKIYSKSMFTSDVIGSFSAAQWWHLLELRSVKDGTFPETFCSFMIGLANCPASSASLERVFSTCGLVWSKLRNRLGIEKAQKLVKVHQYLKTKGQE